MMKPEPCLKSRCYSPVACDGWGYCRERNVSSDPVDENGQRPSWMIKMRRSDAEIRSGLNDHCDYLPFSNGGQP